MSPRSNFLPIGFSALIVMQRWQLCFITHL